MCDVRIRDFPVAVGAGAAPCTDTFVSEVTLLLHGVSDSLALPDTHTHLLQEVAARCADFVLQESSVQGLHVLISCLANSVLSVACA